MGKDEEEQTFGDTFAAIKVATAGHIILTAGVDFFEASIARKEI
jgi:hypothetical protein